MSERLMSAGRRIHVPITLCLALASPAAAQDRKNDRAALEFFEKKIRPVLVDRMTVAR